MLKINNIVKEFSNVKAVDDVSFEVSKGSIYGLLGPNGAGKTTTIRMIMNIIQPDSGEIFIGNRSSLEGSKLNIGYLPEERGLYQKAKVKETIVYFATLQGLDHHIASEKADHWLSRFNLSKNKDSKISELSRGNQQKVQFIITVISDPKLMILDEPFSGLDPVNQKLLKGILNEYKNNNTTIIFSTHQMEQVENICDSICLINKGKVIKEGNLNNIKNEYGGNIVEVEFQENNNKLPKNVLIDQEILPNMIRGKLPNSMGTNDIIKKLTDKYDIKGFSYFKPKLEQIFLKLVEEEKNE
ncbi:MAG: ATP-binding cassette domain-containing protein [Candidatus Marinimicrobia bacterium]|nr:ATP-binding cassette domain-containing protein [Candidatus Neomarinimicrobiota bacterium]